MADDTANPGRDYRQTLFLPELPGDPFPMRAGFASVSKKIRASRSIL